MALCCASRRAAALFARSSSWAVQSRRNFFKLPKIEIYSIRRRFAEHTSNTYDPARVAVLGPDLACLEWLMECGSTSVSMSDGTTLTRISDTRKYISNFGFDLGNLSKGVTLPVLDAATAGNSAEMAKRWEHVPQVHIRQVDGSDSAITDEGFLYFTECRHVTKLKLNHCDYFTDRAIIALSRSLVAKSLLDLEICLNSWLSDGMVQPLLKLRKLQRLHFYFLPYVRNRPAVLRQLKTGLPRCKVTFPDLDKVGYGY